MASASKRSANILCPHTHPPANNTPISELIPRRPSRTSKPLRSPSIAGRATMWADLKKPTPVSLVGEFSPPATILAKPVRSPSSVPISTRPSRSFRANIDSISMPATPIWEAKKSTATNIRPRNFKAGSTGAKRRGWEWISTRATFPTRSPMTDSRSRTPMPRFAISGFSMALLADTSQPTPRVSLVRQRLRMCGYPMVRKTFPSTASHRASALPPRWMRFLQRLWTVRSISMRSRASSSVLVRKAMSSVHTSSTSPMLSKTNSSIASTPVISIRRKTSRTKFRPSCNSSRAFCSM